VGGGVPGHGEVVLSLARLDRLDPVDADAGQVTAGGGGGGGGGGGAGARAGRGGGGARRGGRPGGGGGRAQPGRAAGAGRRGGLRVLRYGPMRSQVRGVEAVLADGTVVSHLAGLVKDNTGYDYPGLLAGSEGTLAVITAARIQLVPRPAGPVTVIVGLGGPGEVHDLARAALRSVPGLLSAEFFTRAGLDVLAGHAGLAPPLRDPVPAFLPLEAAGPGAAEDLGHPAGGDPVAVATTPADRARLWAYRERHPEAAGFLGVPLKLDVSVPAAHWVTLATEVGEVVRSVDPGARLISYGHVADGNLHVNVVPAAE